jgi:hypothetical protein
VSVDDVAGSMSEALSCGEAEELLQRALGIQTRTHGERHQDTGRVLWWGPHTCLDVCVPCVRA